MGLLRTPADDAFSKCIRAAANYTCQRCATAHAQNSKGLHCSHHHGRRHWSIRFDPVNAEALCYGCHQLEGGTEQRRNHVLTEPEQESLFEKMRDQSLARTYKKTKGKGAIAKHYREQHKIIIEKRDSGMTGYINFEPWVMK